MIQRFGLKNNRQLVSKGSCFHLAINPFHPMEYDGYARLNILASGSERNAIDLN
jgi:hypothetical protein